MGGWGSVTPRVAGGAGAQPRYTPRFARQAVGLPPGQTTAFARRCRCARRSARRVGRRGARKARSRTPPKPPARLGWPRTGQRGPGVRYASRPDGRNVPGWTAQAEGSPRPTLIRGPGATEHLQATGTGRRPLQGWRSHRRSRLRPCKGCRAVQRLARAQPPPWRRSGKRAAPAPTRAPHLWSERSERNRRGAQPRGWEGVGPQAVGCGLLRQQQGAPLPCSRYASAGPGQRAACAQPGRIFQRCPGGAACERTPSARQAAGSGCKAAQSCRLHPIA